MLRSIRWTLQLWHAGILALALASLGTALYVAVSHQQMTSVDAELQQAAQALASIPPAPPPGPRPMGPDPGPPDAPPRDDPAGRPDRLPPMNPTDSPRPPPLPPGRQPGSTGEPPSPMPGFQDRHPPAEWGTQIPADALHRVGRDERDQPYFLIFRGDGSIAQKSVGAPDTPAPLRPSGPPWGDPRDPGRRMSPPVFRQRDAFREVIVGGPRGAHVLVGKSLEAEWASLATLRWTLLAAGAGILAIGLCGGWALAARAIRPIRAISQTAQAISGSDLSQRIAIAETQSEFGALAQTLNDTFARLEAAFQRQVRFTADASHELRTPLSVVHAHAELALSRERSAAEYKLALEACLRGAQRMRVLVESLLVLARADVGQLQLQLETFDLQDAVQECLGLIAPQAQSREITVQTHLEAAQVHADRNRILQVITNLLANAVQYNRDAGQVTVTLAPQDAQVVLSVADTGIGMAPEDQAHVFERFFRADKVRSREAGGSGLGLAICHGIIDAHGGHITFTSQLGQGTTFVVRLPQAQSPAAE